MSKNLNPLYEATLPVKMITDKNRTLLDKIADFIMMRTPVKNGFISSKVARKHELSGINDLTKMYATDMKKYGEKAAKFVRKARDAEVEEKLHPWKKFNPFRINSDMYKYYAKKNINKYKSGLFDRIFTQI
jgi:hypothetical protein